MVEKHEIETCFSQELHWIKDKKLRDQVVEVWKKASDLGRWKRLDDIPFTLLLENSGCLIDHTKRVTGLAKTIVDQRKEPLNMDYLIAGALLHDAGKLLEYEISGGRVVKSDYGKKFRHPVSKE